MDATLSAATGVVTTSDLIAQTNNLIAAMAFVGGLFGIAFTIAFGALVFLIWRHNEQSKKAQKEVEKIEQLRKSVESLFKEYGRHFAEMDKILKFYSKSSQTITRDVKEISRLTTEAKKRGANIVEIEKQIKEKQQSLDKEAEGLSNISGVVASNPIIAPSLTEPLREGQTLFPSAVISVSDLADTYKNIQSVYSQLPVKAMREYAETIKKSAEGIRNVIAHNPINLRSRKMRKTAKLRSQQKKKA